MSERKKVYGFLAIVALLALAGLWAGDAFGWRDGTSADSKQEADSSGDQEEAQVIPVRLAIAGNGEISSYVASTANLKSFREVDVVNRTDGVVQTVKVEEGDFVQEGRILARLDDTQLQIGLRSAQGKLSQARLQLEKARIRHEKAETQISNTREEFQRYQQLYEQKLVSEREVAQLRYQIDELEHDERISDSEQRELLHRVDELKAEIEKSQLEISRTEVKAPFSGRITQRMVEIGQTRRAQESLFRLADFNPLLAEVFLSEREALQIRPAQRADVMLGVDASDRILGYVDRVSPVVDQGTGTVKVTVKVPRADGAFKPGAFVRVEIKTDTRERALLIPKRTVIEEDGRHYVYVADSGVARRVDVELGYESGGLVEVRQGLEVGAQVVVAGQGSLKDGAAIKIQESGGAASQR